MPDAEPGGKAIPKGDPFVFDLAISPLRQTLGATNIGARVKFAVSGPGVA
jgi:hypothetical protein